ncbi:hypothetical protein D3C78_1131820 [compost metagenome]
MPWCAPITCHCFPAWVVIHRRCLTRSPGVAVASAGCSSIGGMKPHCCRWISIPCCAGAWTVRARARVFINSWPASAVSSNRPSRACLLLSRLKAHWALAVCRLAPSAPARGGIGVRKNMPWNGCLPQAWSPWPDGVASSACTICRSECCLRRCCSNHCSTRPRRNGDCYCKRQAPWAWPAKKTCVITIG